MHRRHRRYWPIVIDTSPRQVTLTVTLSLILTINTNPIPNTGPNPTILTDANQKPQFYTTFAQTKRLSQPEINVLQMTPNFTM